MLGRLFARASWALTTRWALASPPRLSAVAGPSTADEDDDYGSDAPAPLAAAELFTKDPDSVGILSSILATSDSSVPLAPSRALSSVALCCLTLSMSTTTEGLNGRSPHFLNPLAAFEARKLWLAQVKTSGAIHSSPIASHDAFASADFFASGADAMNAFMK